MPVPHHPKPMRPAWASLIPAGMAFGLGLCFLIYRCVWLRECGPIFGITAFAAAVVDGVMIISFGLGAWGFGRRMEPTAVPLRTSAKLQLGAVIAAIISPQLLALDRTIYAAAGGQRALGAATGLFEMILVVVALGPACFLLGGSMPAIFRFAQLEAEPRRSRMASLSSAALVGAAVGCALASFVLQGVLGNHGTISVTALGNVCLAAVVWIMAPRLENAHIELPLSVPEIPEKGAAAGRMSRPSRSVLLVAGAFGGAVLSAAMRLWCRLAEPLIGGETHIHHLMLCVVLAGMSVGAFLSARRLKSREPEMGHFVLGCTVQGAVIILPALLGDNFAFAILTSNSIARGFGIGTEAVVWTVVCGVLAFLPALIAGWVWPELIALMGRGKTGVAVELGRFCLCTGLGVVLGSVLVGIVLVPWLGVKICWYGLAAFTGLMPVAAVLALRRTAHSAPAIVSPTGFHVRMACGVLVAGVAAALLCQGPSAVWQHPPPIAEGGDVLPKNQESLEDWKRTVRRSLVESFDGRESGIALVNRGPQGMVIDSPGDEAVADRVAQVMPALTAAALHPNPRRACVLGLGDGAAVGWLADLPEMDQVDAVESEPLVQDLARRFSLINRNAMVHSKVNHLLGDIRETLCSSVEHYDVVISRSPSSGATGLGTLEFYEAVRQKLNEGGIFCQSVPRAASLETVDTLLATVGAVFPKVEVWSSSASGLFLVAGVADSPWNADVVAKRLQREPLASGFRRFWYTDSVEGFAVRCVANGDFSKQVAKGSPTINTDDLNVLDYRHSRPHPNAALELRRKAFEHKMMLSKWSGRPLDGERTGRERVECLWYAGQPCDEFLGASGVAGEANVARVAAAFKALVGNQPQAFLQSMMEVPLMTVQERRQTPISLCMVNDPRAAKALQEFQTLDPEDGSLLQCQLAYLGHDYPAARRALISACGLLRKSPWVDLGLVQKTLALVEDLGNAQTHAAPADAQSIYLALREPFALNLADDLRLAAMTSVAGHLNDETRLDMIAAWGPHFPWRGLPLAIRTGTFMTTHDPRLTESLAELQGFLDDGGQLPKAKAGSSPKRETAAAN